MPDFPLNTLMVVFVFLGFHASKDENRIDAERNKKNNSLTLTFQNITVRNFEINFKNLHITR